MADLAVASHGAGLAQQPELVLVDVAAVAGWLLSGWLLLVTVLALASRLPETAGRAAAGAMRVITPALVRRSLEALLGISIAMGPAGAALAATTPGLAPVPAPVVAPAEVRIPSLDRPSAPLVEIPAPAQRHVVVSGDTLWGLAAAALPAGASPREITEAWHRWYSANRATIGADPDLLLPGAVLELPRSAR